MMKRLGIVATVVGMLDVLAPLAEASSITDHLHAVSELGSMLLLGVGLVGVGAVARRRWARKP